MSTTTSNPGPDKPDHAYPVSSALFVAPGPAAMMLR